MNTRALYIALAVQVFFGLVLLAVGTHSRDNRRHEYMEQSHKVTSGFGTEADFVELAQRLPKLADHEQVRLVFGLPVVARTSIVMSDSPPPTDLTPETGDYWLYYPREGNAAVDPTTVREIKDWRRCFVIEFDKSGMRLAKMKWVAPVDTANPKSEVRNPKQ